MSRFAIRRPPFLDRAIGGFDRWWSALSVRERWLIGVLGALVAGAVLVYGVVKPLQAAHAQAVATIRQYETLNARIRAAGALNTAPVAAASGPPEQIVQQAAQRNGVAATVVPSENGARAVVADASYGAVIAWLGDVQRSSALGVTRAEITRLPAPGHVSATLEFGR